MSGRDDDAALDPLIGLQSSEILNPSIANFLLAKYFARKEKYQEAAQFLKIAQEEAGKMTEIIADAKEQDRTRYKNFMTGLVRSLAVLDQRIAAQKEPEADYPEPGGL